MNYVIASRLLDLNWLYIFKKSQSYRTERYSKSQCCNMVLQFYTVYPFSEWVVHTESKFIVSLYFSDLVVGQLHKSLHNIPKRCWQYLLEKYYEYFQYIFVVISTFKTQSTHNSTLFCKRIEGVVVLCAFIDDFHNSICSFLLILCILRLFRLFAFLQWCARYTQLEKSYVLFVWNCFEVFAVVVAALFIHWVSPTREHIKQIE